MGLKTGITLDSGDEKRLMDKIRRLERTVNTDFPKILNRDAKKTEDQMYRDAPVDTGRLRTEIHFTQTDKHKIEFESKAIDPDSGIDYAPVQNFGGRFIRATYYFTKNITRLRRRLRTSLTNALNKTILK